MSDFPPRERLRHVLTSLSAQLPEQAGTLLVDDRFSAGAAALARLSRRAHLDSALEQMTPAEAGWLADEVLKRWSDLTEAALEPAVAIQGPDEVWLGRRSIQVELSVASLDVEPGFEVEWSGPVDPVAGACAVLTLEPPAGDQASQADVRVRVVGRSSAGRCVLVATHRVVSRRPHAVLDPSRRRLIVRDQTGKPAGVLRLVLNGDELHTGRSGLLKFDEPLERGFVLELNGVRVPEVE